MSDGFKKGAKTFVQFVVAAVAFGFGVRLLWIAQRLIDSGAVSDKWPIVGVLAMGSFLLVGSQYKKFKAGTEGVEAERFGELFGLMKELSARYDGTAYGVLANRAHIQEISRELVDSGALSQQAVGRINAVVGAGPSTARLNR